MPRVTRDGVTIVKNLIHKDNIPNIGMDLIKQVSHNANKFAGDGTTTAAILASAIYKHGMLLKQGGFNPILMQRGIKKAQQMAENFLQQIKIPVSHETDLERLMQVAMVALSGDEELANIAANAIHVCGPFGNVYFEESNRPETSLSVLEGLFINRGYASVNLLTRITDSELVLQDPLVLIIDEEVKDMELITPALEIAKESNKTLLLIARDISDDVMAQLTFHRKNSMIGVELADKCTGIDVFGELRRRVYGRLGAVVGRPKA